LQAEPGSQEIVQLQSGTQSGVPLLAQATVLEPNRAPAVSPATFPAILRKPRRASARASCTVRSRKLSSHNILFIAATPSYSASNTPELERAQRPAKSARFPLATAGNSAFPVDENPPSRNSTANCCSSSTFRRALTMPPCRTKANGDPANL